MPTSNGKTLTPEESARVRSELEKLMARFPSQGELALWIGDISQQTISHVMKGKPAGTKLARALAAKLGVTFDALIGADDHEPARPVFKNLTGWAEAEKEARRMHRRIPEFAWRLAGETSAAQPPAQIDAATVYSFARAWQDVHTDEQEKRVEEVEMVVVGELVAKEDAAYAQRAFPPETRALPPLPPSAKALVRAGRRRRDEAVLAEQTPKAAPVEGKKPGGAKTS